MFGNPSWARFFICKEFYDLARSKLLDNKLALFLAQWLVLQVRFIDPCISPSNKVRAGILFLVNRYWFVDCTGVGSCVDVGDRIFKLLLVLDAELDKL